MQEFRQSLFSAIITLPLAHMVSPSTTQPSNALLNTYFNVTSLQFYWIVKGINERLPLFIN